MYVLDGYKRRPRTHIMRNIALFSTEYNMQENIQHKFQDDPNYK